MNRAAKLSIVKHAIYVFLMLFFYILQCVPGLFVIRGVKPFWVIPAAVAIAMLEGEFAGGIYGALAGLLCDTGGFLLFGVNGFIICLCCVASGLLVIFLMRCNLLSCLLFVFVTLLLRGGIEYFFAYGMWSYENAQMVFTRSIFPTVVYSAAVTPPVFLLLRAVRRRFAALEEQIL